MEMKSRQSSPIDEWIQLAFCEYEQIASLSNVQSLLGNAITSMPSSSQSNTEYYDSISNTKNIYDPKILSEQMQRNSVQDLLSSYGDRIDEVRKTHASLKTKASLMFGRNRPQQGLDEELLRKRPSSAERALGDHIQLSERVIRTIMRSPQPGFSGPCGLFYENGLIRTATAGDHENNVVALAALRASLSRIKKEFGEGS